MSDEPKLALTRTAAAKSMSMSLDSFERYVQPYLRLWRRGRLRLVPVSELKRFLDEEAKRTLPGDRS